MPRGLDKTYTLPVLFARSDCDDAFRLTPAVPVQSEMAGEWFGVDNRHQPRVAIPTLLRRPRTLQPLSRYPPFRCYPVPA